MAPPPDNDLIYRAAGLVIGTQFGSINMLRRQLDISHAKAAQIMTVLEENGIVGAEQHGRSRDVLVRAERVEEARADWAPPTGLDPRRYTTKEAAEILCIPAKTISLWRTRGVVTPAGIVGRGRGAPVYRLDDLRPHADTYKQRRTQRR